MEPILINNRYELLKSINGNEKKLLYAARDIIDGKKFFLQVIIPAREIFERRISEFLSYYRYTSKWVKEIECPYLARMIDFGDISSPCRSKSSRFNWQKATVSNGSENEKQEVSIPSGSFYFVFEHFQGKSVLEAGINSHELIIPVILKVLKALDVIHKTGRIHYGISPETIFISDNDQDNEVKIFGLGLDGPNLWEGFSSNLCAPELKLDLPHDNRVDLYSVGVTLYRLFTGQDPFLGKPSEILEQQKNGPKSPLEINSNISSEISQIILKLISWKPEDRFRDAFSVVKAISESTPVSFLVPELSPLSNCVFAAPLIKKQAVLEEIQNAVLDNKNKTGGIIKRLHLLQGETGIGKSRILSEIDAFCNFLGIPSFKIECTSSPFPLAPLFQLIVDVHAKIGSPSLDLPSKFFDSLYSYSPISQDFIARFPFKVSEIRTRELMLQKLSEYARKSPIVILIDDLHLANDMVLSFLRSLVSHVSNSDPCLPVLLISAYDKDQGKAIENIFAGDEDILQFVVKHELSSLSKEETERLTACFLGDSAPPQPLLNKVFLLSEGRPLYVDEIVRFYIELSNKGNSSPLLPERFKEILLIRLASISNKEKQILLLLALSDVPLSLKLLSMVTQTPPEDTIAYLSMLERDGLVNIIRKDISTEACFTISSQEIRKQVGALHENITAESLSLAKVMEKEESKNKEFQLARLFTLSGDRDKSFKYILKVLSALIQLGLYTDASYWGRQLIEMSEEKDPSEKAYILVLLGEILFQTGLEEESISCLKNAHKESPSQVRPLLRAAEFALYRGDQEFAAKALERASQWVRTAPILDAYHLFLQGYIKYKQGNPQRGCAFIQEGLSRIESEIKREQKEPSDVILYCAWITGDFMEFSPEAHHFLNRATEIAKNSGDLLSLALCYKKTSFIEALEGEYEKAIEDIGKSIEILEKFGNFYEIAQCLIHLADYNIRLGQYRNVLPLLNQAERFGLEHKILLVLSSCYYVRGKLAFVRGDMNEARSLHLRALKRHENTNNLENLCLTYCELAEIEHREENIREAASYCKKAEDAAVRLSYPRLLIEVFLVKARMAETGEDQDKHALLGLDRAIKLAADHGYKEYLWQIYYRRGQLYKKIGDIKSSLDDFQKSRECLSEVSQRLSEEARQIFTAVPEHRAVKKMFAIAADELNRKTILAEGKRSGYYLISDKGHDGKEESVVYNSDDIDNITVRRLRSQNIELLRLLELNKKINSERGVGNLLQLIMDTAVELTSAERGFLILLEEGQINFKVARNFEKEAIKKPEFQISHSIAERVIKTGQAILTTDAVQDKRFDGYRSVSDLKLHSVLTVPLRVKERVIGALYIDNRTEKAVFSERDKALLEVFADQAAIAIENARLIEENLKKQEELRRSKERIEKLNIELENLNAQLAQKVEHQSKELKEVRAILTKKESELATKYNYSNIIGRSPKVQELFSVLDKLTDNIVPVHIYGESGTGKELVARAIHFNGPRQQKNFMSENCAALSDTLLESELFGHEKGAFTGAHKEKKGLFELANGGTLFLDEVGEMSSEMQKKLLRVLQESEVRRVGGKDIIQVDVRIISASNKDLKTLVEKGEFRDDLFYRLNVICLRLPPLRERKEDIPLLVEHFLKEFAKETGEEKKVEKTVYKLLSEYDWPGNIRELRNVLYRVFSLSNSDILTGKDFEGEVSPKSDQKSVSLFDAELSIDEYAMRFTLAYQSKYNDSQIAKILGISRKTLWEKRKKWGIAK